MMMMTMMMMTMIILCTINGSRPRLNCYDQDNQELVDLVRDSVFRSTDPSRGYNTSLITDGRLNIEHSDDEEELVEQVLKIIEHDPKDLSFDMVEMFFKDVKNGFFIEAGAASGLEDSHTLLLEVRYNWTGLLVEPGVNNLLFLNRRAPHVLTCLATQHKPHYVNFETNSAYNKSENERSMAGIVNTETETSMTLQCIPLYTLLLAAGNPTVNWFILDIEGAEYQVLQTIPWNQVDIEMISVETDLAGLVMEGSREEIIDYMRQQGYIHKPHKYKGTSCFKEDFSDDLFIREDVARRYNILTETQKTEL